MTENPSAFSAWTPSPKPRIVPFLTVTRSWPPLSSMP
jgi:hypothetical protein